MRTSDEFDQVLDDALAEYREAEPLAGLEERVLQRVRLQTDQRRRLWWRWIATPVAAAVLLIAVWIGVRDRTRHEVVAPSVLQKQAPIESPQPSINTHADNRQLPNRTPGAKTAARSTPVPAPVQLPSREPARMPERFPSPAPIKPEERMLVALATTHPEILMDQPATGQQIVIDLINIKPLVDVTSGSQGEN
jgi:hypothetical protein